MVGKAAVAERADVSGDRVARKVEVSPVMSKLVSNLSQVLQIGVLVLCDKTQSEARFDSRRECSERCVEALQQLLRRLRWNHELSQQRTEGVLSERRQGKH